MNGFGGHVIGVVGGSGGVGATWLATLLAGAAGDALLIDVDVLGGGIDVALGLERAPGARWSGLRLAGGRLDPAELFDGVLQWDGCAVLAADVGGLDADAVVQVLEVAASVRPVVLDLPRGECPERSAALACCDLVVLLTRADVAGLVAAHAVAGTLPAVPAGVVVRHGAVDPVQAAELVGLPLLGELPALGAAVPDPTRPPRQALRLAAGILAGVRPGRREPLHALGLTA